MFLFSAPNVPVFGLGALSDSEQEEGKITTVIFLCNIFQQAHEVMIYAQFVLWNFETHSGPCVLHSREWQG